MISTAMILMIEKTIIKLTSIFALFFFSLFFILSISVTTDITWTEDLAPYSYRDFPIVHFICIAIVIYIFTKVKKKNGAKENTKLISSMCLLMSLLTIIFMGYMQADPMKCLTIAEEMQGIQRGHSYFLDYMRCYPIQSFYILYVGIFVKLFGSVDFIAIKVVSIIMYACILKMLHRIFSEEMGKEYSWYADLAMVFFLPGWMVSEFGYNDIHAMFFAMSSVYLLHYKKNAMRLIPAIFLMAIACAIRSNLLIFVIAFLLIFTDQKNFRTHLLWVVGSLLIYRLFSQSAYAYIAGRYPEITVNRPYVNLSRWILIGLSDSMTGAGWWSPETGLSFEPAEEGIRNILGEWVKHPLSFVTFELRKFTNGITIPDFEALDAYRHKESIARNALWFKYFIYDRNEVYQVIFWILNLFQSLLYAGNCLYLALKKEKTRRELFGIIFFVGTSCFHSFWEIKARYFIMAMMMVVPTAVIGFELLTDKINRKKRRKWIPNGFTWNQTAEEDMRNEYVLILGILGFLALAALMQMILLTPVNQEKLNALSSMMDKMWYGGF